ncbi:MAG: hypothetical protein HY329_11170 [Chloroflexi bacterium]|nr:hypothetical protein [Chloroflexota bacterium]
MARSRRPLQFLLLLLVLSLAGPTGASAWDATYPRDSSRLLTLPVTAPSQVALRSALDQTRPVTIVTEYKNERSVHAIHRAHLMLLDRGTGDWLMLYAEKARDRNVWNAGDQQYFTYSRVAGASRTRGPFKKGTTAENPVAGRPCATEIESTSDCVFLRDLELQDVQVTPTTETNPTPNLRLTWTMVFVTPQVKGPVELWTSVEEEQRITGGRGLAAGWDKRGEILIGNKPTVESATAPSTVTAGTQGTFSIIGADADGRRDLQKVLLLLIDTKSNRWVQLIWNDEDETFQIYDDRGTYSHRIDRISSRVQFGGLTLDPSLSRGGQGDPTLRADFSISLDPSWRGANIQVYGIVTDRELNVSGQIAGPRFDVR